MKTKLSAGDQVRIKGGGDLWTVAAVDPPGAQAREPSSYVVLIARADGKGPPQLYGDHRLERVEPSPSSR